MSYNAIQCHAMYCELGTHTVHSTIIIMYCEVSMPETNGEPEPQLLRFKIILC